MAPTDELHLSRRERQIMDVLYRLGEATAADIVARLPDAPAYNSVRVTLGILERKGYVGHRQEGPRYVYAPTIPADRAGRSAARHLLRTFFDGSPSRAILALLDSGSSRLSRMELDEIAAMIERARRRKDP
jgi:BlaI family transcriptional regulator, penicillinase repressor